MQADLITSGVPVIGNGTVDNKGVKRLSIPFAAHDTAISTRTNSAMTPQAAISEHGNKMTQYEMQEILSYREVYTVGENCLNKIRPSAHRGNNNYGFDNDKNDYAMIDGDHVAYRWLLLKSLGKGAFGQVYKAQDMKTGETVALKAAKNDTKYRDQANVEIGLLKRLNELDPEQKHNIVRMKDSCEFRSHVFIAFELEGMNLYDLLKSANFKPMPLAMIKSIAHQMLQTLRLTARERIAHCDIKPENIVIKRGSSKVQIRVIDFGLSCYEDKRIYTYIQSRIYRAPEIMLGIPYTSQIDMWSLGCMLAELATGTPLCAGESEGEQLAMIMDLFGPPDRDVLSRGKRRNLFFDAYGQPKQYRNRRGQTHGVGTRSLSQAIYRKLPQQDDVDGLFLDLLRGLMTYDHTKRLTPDRALRHPFFRSDRAHKNELPAVS